MTESAKPLKTLILLGDGMADFPIPELGGKTPLMAAHTPAMDRLAREGRTGLFLTVEDDLPPGSEIANLTVLGYDPRAVYQGRGVLEAASLGVTLAPDDVAMRVNLICIENGRIKSHSAGHISTEEAHALIQELQTHLANWPLRLTPGLSYRHLLVMPGADPRLACAPPHDHVGEAVADLLVKPLVPEAAATADLLNRLIAASQEFLAAHPLNAARSAAGQQPANALWPWSPGRRPRMATFQERFGVRGAVITAVDLIKGLGIYAGMDVLPVEGATGLYDTNYEGKADAALAALDAYDLVYVHVEAPDEAGHARDLALKIRCIEDLDRWLMQRLLDGLGPRLEETIVAVLPDHPTPVATGSHVHGAVPVAIRDPRHAPDAVLRYDEESVKAGALGLLRGADFIERVVMRRS